MYTGKLPASFEKILAGMEEVEITPPTIQLNADGTQHVVGVLPEELQRLMCLWKARHRQYNENVEKAQAEVDAIDSRAQQKETAKRLQNLLDQEGREVKELADNLWTSMRLTFPELADKKVIGIADGFQAYWEDIEDEEFQCDCPSCREARGELPSAFSILGPMMALPALGALLKSLRQSAEDPAKSDKPKDSPAKEETPQG